jgi:DNA-binding XRE family transcriptional regulator
MKRLPRIIKIISVRNFIVRSLWNNGEVRDIDFKPIMETWEQDKEEMYEPLYDPKKFKTVSVSPEHTLCWPNVTLKVTFKGVTKVAPLDLDPDVLYEQSKLIKRFERPKIGHILRQARENAGLSQSQVALNSGTSRTYISRIENEHSDIQFDVFYKIVTLGMGKEVKVSIE